jgi:hypothetical protein
VCEFCYFVFLCLKFVFVTLKCICSSIHIRSDAVNCHSNLGNSEGGSIDSDEDVSIFSVWCSLYVFLFLFCCLIC